MQTVTTGRRLIIRHIIFLLILVTGFGVVAVSRDVKVDMIEAELYFVDAEMLRLLPVRVQIPATTAENMAQRVLDELISGRDENPKIRRLIPNEKGCMKVQVRDKIAYVDINSEKMKEHPDGRNQEMLTVYSVVNSLTSIDGIVNVRFTIDGKTQKDFMGYIDMRETFIPDYFV